MTVLAACKKSQTRLSREVFQEHKANYFFFFFLNFAGTDISAAAAL